MSAVAARALGALAPGARRRGLLEVLRAGHGAARAAAPLPVAGWRRRLSAGGGGGGAAPAVGAFGLPEATAQGWADAPPAPQGATGARRPEEWQTVAEAVAALRGLGAAAASEPEALTHHPDLPTMTERALALAAAAPVSELADLAEVFVELRLRFPLRDLLPIVASTLRGAGDDELPDAIRFLTACGRGALFPGELLEFCAERVRSMQAREISTFVYEAGRHGLRSRQQCANAMPRAIELLPEMSPVEMMRAWQGFVRFSRDRADFFVAALPLAKQHLEQLTVPQLLLVLRASRDHRRTRDFVQLHALACKALTAQADNMTMSQVADAMMYTVFSPVYRSEAQGLVLRLLARLNQTQDLSGLGVADVVCILETLASWSLKPAILVNRLDSLLVERKVELQYTGNVSLWMKAVQHFGRMELQDAKWPEAAIELARDPAFLQRISFFQQGDLAMAFARLRRHDPTVFDNIAEALLSDIGLWKELPDMSSVIFAFATLGNCHERLFNAAYDKLLEWMENEAIDLSSRANSQEFAKATWAFTVAGFHKTEESFAAVLDYALFSDPAATPTRQLRTLAQMVDVVAVEAPTCASNCQYQERLQWVRTDKRVRDLVASDRAGDLALLQDIRVALHKLGWKYQASLVPDGLSAFVVDISFEPHSGAKAGLVASGKHELAIDGLHHEGLPMRETGELSLARRAHAARGWRVTPVDRRAWSQLQTDEARKAYLERLAAPA